MSNDFNPYAEWLGLTNVGSRPNHYLLLGLEPFTDDPQKVKQAADRTVTRVRGFRPGDKARIWANLLDEIDAARKCLSDEVARSNYDEQLRQLGPESNASPQGVSGLAAGAVVNKAPSNPAMYPPGMGGPLPERYGPAGPAPDDAPQQLASAAPGGVSRYAPGYDAMAGGHSPGQQPVNIPVTPPGKVPMSRESGGAPVSIDPMTPVYGLQPYGDPMAPVADANVVPVTPQYGATPQTPGYSPANYDPAAYGAAPYGDSMQPVTAVPAQPVGGANPMAPIAMPVGAGGNQPAGVATSEYQGAYRQANPGWGQPTSGPQAVPVIGGPSKTQPTPANSGPQMLLIGFAATILLSLGGLIAFMVMCGDGQNKPNEEFVVAFADKVVDPVNDAQNVVNADTNPAPVIRPEPEPEPVPEPAPEPKLQPPLPPEPEPERPLPIPEPAPIPEPIPEPPPVPMLSPQETAALKQALVAARQAMTDADLPAARSRLAEAEKFARSNQHKALVERTKELEHYLTQFWASFDKAYAALKPTGVLTIDTAEAAIVEVRPDALVIKWFGKNRTVPRQGMPPGLVMAIANNWFNDEPANKVVKGAYYLVNDKPDKAEMMWSEAGASGISVQSLMLVLDDNYEL